MGGPCLPSAVASSSSGHRTEGQHPGPGVMRLAQSSPRCSGIPGTHRAAVENGLNPPLWQMSESPFNNRARIPVPSRPPLRSVRLVALACSPLSHLSLFLSPEETLPCGSHSSPSSWPRSHWPAPGLCGFSCPGRATDSQTARGPLHLAVQGPEVGSSWPHSRPPPARTRAAHPLHPDARGWLPLWLL